jgi:hypothetical protein
LQFDEEATMLFPQWDRILRQWPHKPMTIRRVALVAFSLMLSFCHLPATFAVPLSVSQDLSFSTQDQSMWAPGDNDVVNKSFDAKIVNIHTGDQTFGEIGELSTSIPNPAYGVWYAAYHSCLALFSSSTCINGGNIPFVGHVRGLGSAPPTTLTVEVGKNGIQINYNVDVEAGLKGGVTLDGGKVSVNYPTQVTLQTDKDAYNPGDIVTLGWSENVGTPSMTTDFSNLDLSLSAYASLDAVSSLDAYLGGLGTTDGPLSLTDIHTGLLQRELFGASVGDGGIGVRIFGKDPLVFDTTGGIGANIFSVDFPPEEVDPFLRIPLADFQVQVPSLDTQGVPPDSTWDGNVITNTQLPIDRNVNADSDLTLIGGGAGFTRTDFAKADVDVDGLISVASIVAEAPVVFGLTAGIPGLLSGEGNLIDFDLGAFFGFGQTMTFDPNLQISLKFSEPIQVETPSGLQQVDSVDLGSAKELKLVFPDDGLLEITPTYSLDNLFTNLTQFLISPVASLSVLELKLSGLIPTSLGVDFDAALVQQVIPLADPIPAATLGSSSPFKLEGFNTVEGNSLRLAALAPTVPEPATLALTVLGLALLVISRRRVTRGSGDGCARPMSARVSAKH